MFYDSVGSEAKSFYALSLKNRHVIFYGLLHGKKIKARLRLIQVYFDIKILG